MSFFPKSIGLVDVRYPNLDAGDRILHAQDALGGLQRYKSELPVIIVHAGFEKSRRPETASWRAHGRWARGCPGGK